jgi:hypothetical protein
VRAHVRGDRGALRELAVAYFTSERLLARMRPQMSGQIGSLCERFTASVALVRFLTLYFFC